MNEQMRRERLENILDAFVATGDTPDSATLEAWIHRYPEYSQELTDFAVSWSLMLSLPPSPSVESVDDESLILRGMSVVQNLLHKQRSIIPSEEVAPMESLLKEGRTHGLSPHQLAQNCEIGNSVLRKLDRRLLIFVSIPLELIEMLGTAIQRRVDDVIHYLQQDPTFAVNTQHRAEQAPQLTPQEDFFDAVRNDPTLNDEQRARWLRLETSNNE